MKKEIYAADLFCGAGGTSSGLKLACKEKDFELKLLAINHWDVAIATHSKNHPDANHLCENLDNVNPRKVVPKGYLDILVASPECTHHSNARGGRPMSDQSRASAWHVLRWAEALRVKNILIENVKEFRNWGPLGSNGRPLKRKKGELFKAFIVSLKAMGYYVDCKVLNAANYGDPTTRQRLFIIARKGKKVKWPVATHTPNGDMTLLGKTSKWKAAREIIDWDIPGKSIFERKKPLSENTMKRIVAGLRKFSGKELEPFLVKLYKTGDAANINKPVPTITTIPKLGLCQPFLVEYYGNGKARPISKPLPTQTAKDRFGIVEPFIVRISQTGSGGDQVRSVDKPLATVLTKEELAVCEPFIVPHYGERDGQEPRFHSVDDPPPTVTSVGAGSLVMPEFNGQKLDIKFRMLLPHELARAMSFEDYEFCGKRTEIVKQIGNAVPVNIAKHLCMSILN